jgi:hypothetical protein
LDRFPFLAIVGLVIIVPAAVEFAWEYYSGLTWGIPSFYWFGPLFLFANFVAIIAMVACWKLNTIKYVVLLLLGVPLNFFLTGALYRRERPFLNGLSNAAQRANLEPIRQWALSHQPPKGEEIGWHHDADLPEEIWQLIPYKDGKPYVGFQRFPDDGDWMLVIDHSGGFVHHNGVILALGEKADPTRAGFYKRARHVAPNVWVFDGG